MSGIVGVYRLDGAPAEPEAAARMIGRLAHRGPDGSGVWHAGPVALGHNLLRTVPEAPTSAGPYHYEHFTLTADLRLDNRDELAAKLGLDPHEARALSDEDYVLRAYAKWEADCVEHLLGPFMFALWDARTQTLFCARDHFGMKPFYYTRDAHRLLFASEIKGLFAYGDVPREPNEERIADFLASIILNDTYTFYQHVHRLPRGSTLTLSGGDVRIRTWYTLEMPDELHLPSDEAYAEAFREVWDAAVRSRLRALHMPVCTLSGGLDSSAVACTVRDLVPRAQGDVNTFSVVYDDVPQCDERPFMQAVVDKGGFQPHWLDGDATPYTPLKSAQRLVDILDEPSVARNTGTTLFIYDAVSAAGFRTKLGGQGGDETISHGTALLNELAAAGRWIALWKELSPLQHVYGFSMSDHYIQWVRYHLRVNNRAGLFARGAKRVLSKLTALRALRSESQDRDILDLKDYIRKSFAQRVDLADRIAANQEAHPRSAHDARTNQFRTLLSPVQPFVFEMFDNLTAAYGLEERHPYRDKRLIDFSLRLPADMKRRHGRNRYIVRYALRDILPAEIQQRLSKAEYSPVIVRDLRYEVSEGRLLPEGEELERIEAYVDAEPFLDRFGNMLWRGGDEPFDLINFTAVVPFTGLVKWINQTAS